MNHNNNQEQFTAKIFIVGDFGVGKTSLITRYWERTFFEDTKNIHIEYKIRTNTVQEKRIRLHVWDTLGQETYRTVSPNFYKGTEGIIFCYAINDKKTFKSLDEYWRKEVENNGAHNACKILIGAKSDLAEREVDEAEGRRKAEEWRIEFFETSSRDNIGIDHAIEFLAREIKRKKVDGLDDNMRLTDAKDKTKKKCCLSS